MEQSDCDSNCYNFKQLLIKEKQIKIRNFAQNFTKAWQMFNKEYRIFTTTIDCDIEEMAQSILCQIKEERDTILKISFFGQPADTKEYKQNITVLYNTVKKFFGKETPVVSYIAQRPHGCSLLAEVTTLLDSDITIERNNEYILLCNNEYRELISGGIIPDNLEDTIYNQATDIFSKISNILNVTGFSINDIYRQWNYIEEITVVDNGKQNYQEFNDARSLFYSNTEWGNGYPAATGIGVRNGGVMIEFMACNAGLEWNYPIDNPLQVSAHNYSAQVLAGNTTHKTTPKFERARLLNKTIYISGTAAIKGEESIDDNNTLHQAKATMEIMNNLISKGNMPVECNNTFYRLLRVYIKNCNDITAVQEFMEMQYADAEKYYLTADICRQELLIEIEGIAGVK